MSDTAGSVCIFSPDLIHALETIGFYFSRTGAKVTYATLPTGGGTEHPWSLKRIEEAQHHVRSLDDEPIHSELLIADAFLKPAYAKRLARWSTKSAHLAFLFPHDGATLKRRTGHLLRLWPQSVLSRTSIFVGQPRLTLDTLPPLLQRRAFYAPYIHPQLFCEDRLQQAFAGFSDDSDRPYTLGFIGNRNPAERARVLEQCRGTIDETGAKTLWIDYGDDGHHTALTPTDYIDALGQMDFCLCPSGWGGNWTHRVLESLCRGAIPILPDLHLYGLGLQHTINCIEVKHGDWNAAIRSALAISPSELRQMRQRIRRLRDALLTPDAASARYCDQFQKP